MGPAIGGFIISQWSYAGLFWVDGLSCIGATVLMVAMLRPKEQEQKKTPETKDAGRTPTSDVPFLLAMLASLFIAIPFLQYFSTMPIYYRDEYGMNEFTIGLVLGFNGLLIFLLEMPLIKGCEDREYSLFGVLRFSAVLIGASFAVLIIYPHVAVVWIGMTLLTVGEMLNFPFLNRFVYDRADKGKPGAYMAGFTITWSIAHIVGHPAGLNSIEYFGFNATWLICGAMIVAAILLLSLAERRLEQEVSCQH